MLAASGACGPLDRTSSGVHAGQAGAVALDPTALAALNRLADARGLRVSDGKPLRFIDAARFGRLSAVEYETEIASTGRVPTRCVGDGVWHDWFNALVWLAWPATKAALNRGQAKEIARTGSVGGRRGARRDALTLFDESGVVLVSDCAAIRACLRERRWRELFVTSRQDFIARAGVWVLGHGLLDKLRRPFKGACGQTHVLALPAASERESVDLRLAQALRRGMPLREFLFPLPVLGVPGWWPENHEPRFYRDTKVFRP
jgi:hypothetical protein